MILTDDEIQRLPIPQLDVVDVADLKGAWWIPACKVIAQAAAKKILEWGNEPCKEHFGRNLCATRRHCEVCWQQLQKEIE